MARLACVNVPALPLQLLLRRHPDWVNAPVAVVAGERARSSLLWVNELAWKGELRPGMRHSAALSLCPALRAERVPAQEAATEVKALTQRLQRHSPHVEASREEPGTFWVAAEGLERLHPDLQAWAAKIGGELRTARLHGTVVVGFDRFSTYAVSRTHRGIGIFLDPEQERRAARQAPLARLGIAPEVRDDLGQLGICTLADLLGLPPVGLLQRFGPPLYRLHRLASGSLAEGMEPDPEELPIQQTVVLEYPESDTARLLFLIKSKLEPLLVELRGRRQALKVLHLRLLLEGRTPEETSVRPATPSREPALILDLVRLRLEGVVLEGGLLESGLLESGLLESGVNGIDLLAEGETRLVEQLSLFSTGLKRDLAAAEQALARVRAEFGEQSVVRAELREAHLPEDRFAWGPLQRIQPPQPQPACVPSLVRRLFARPQVLGTGKAPFGPASKLQGPYPLSGGWWDAEWNRDDAFVENSRGDLLWVYRDRRDERWFLQGRVE